MASRAAQKQQAREQRLAEEQARSERARRERRLRMLGGVVLLVVAVVAIAIAISSGGSKAPKVSGSSGNKAASTVNGLLAGIPQSGNTLGSPSAKVTVTEFGDLVCPVCRDFALGPENQIISNDVKSGKVKLVYRALETASATANNSMFVPSQTAVRAAGLQGKAWDYIELFYHLQGDETTSYVTPSFLDGLAKLVPGLDYSKWALDSGQSSLKAQVAADQGSATSKGYTSTPTVVVAGPKGQQAFTNGVETYSTYESAIKAAS